MPEDGSSVVCCVTLQAVTLKLTLSAKLLSSKSLENGVLNPFLKAFNKKMPSTAHKFAENIERIELDGKDVGLDVLMEPAGSLLTGPAEHRLQLFVPEDPEDAAIDISTEAMKDASELVSHRRRRNADPLEDDAAWSFVSTLSFDDDELKARQAKERQESPAGWQQAQMRLWSHVMRPDASDGPPGDPLTPLTARLLMKFTEDPEDKSKRPMMSKEALMRLLYGDSGKLRELCKQLTDALRQQIRSSGSISQPALRRLDALIDDGTTFAFVHVRRLQAENALPVRVWDSDPDAPLRSVLRLPGTTTAEELWDRAIKPHLPCVVSGAFPGLVALASPESLASAYGNHRVPARRRFRADESGRRVFTEQPSDTQQSNYVHFGDWVRDAAASADPAAVRRAKEAYPAKTPLRSRLPELEKELMARADTPLGKYGSCVGRMTEDGIYMYAGAGENTTHTHIDPAENFMFVAAGRKTLQLFPPSDYQFLYPYPAPKYHSSAIPPFTKTSSPPPEFPAYGYSHPIEVTLEAGDMLYLPAFWYHCVHGPDGFNLIFAWWTEIHANKRDDAPPGLPFEPSRPDYEASATGAGLLSKGAMDDLP